MPVVPRVTRHSAAFQDVGYKGEIGYQTFLYSNEPEIRSLLMFLVEKLPRESAEASDQPTGTENTCLGLSHFTHHRDILTLHVLVSVASLFHIRDTGIKPSLIKDN